MRSRYCKVVKSVRFAGIAPIRLFKPKLILVTWLFAHVILNQLHGVLFANQPVFVVQFAPPVELYKLTR